MLLQITPFQRHDYHVVQEALRSRRVHHHVDWEPLHKWLYDPLARVFLAWEGHILQGVLAYSPPQQNTCWLRLLILPNQHEDEILQALWADSYLQPNLHLIAAMPTRKWLIPFLESLGFVEIQRVIHLERPAQARPALESPPHITLKRVQWHHVRVLAELDHLAFGQGLWQLRESELREANRHAFHYTLAQIGREVVGYQITMRYGKTLHLSRLAVLPSHQNQQVGTTLLSDLIRQAEKAGIESITVNTQSDNIASQRLYERWGFRYEENITPIYGFDLTKNESG